jgi:hypothetical protein
LDFGRRALPGVCALFDRAISAIGQVILRYSPQSFAPHRASHMKNGQPIALTARVVFFGDFVKWQARFLRDCCRLDLHQRCAVKAFLF